LIETTTLPPDWLIIRALDMALIEPQTKYRLFKFIHQRIAANHVMRTRHYEIASDDSEQIRTHVQLPRAHEEESANTSEIGEAHGNVQKTPTTFWR
jgi:hypothetical protein